MESLTIPKDKIILHKSLVDSFFGTLMKTGVGDKNKYVTFDVEALIALTLPSFDFDSLIDRFSIDKELYLSYVIKSIISKDMQKINIIEQVVRKEKFKLIIPTSTFDACFKMIIFEDIDKSILKLVDSAGWNLLFWYCRNGYTNYAVKLIEKFGEDSGIDHIDPNGDTFLMLACRVNKYKMNREELPLFFINNFPHKCNPSHVNNNGLTALMLSCYESSINVANKLIDTFGMDCAPQTVDKNGNTVLMLSCDERLIDISNKLITTFGLECVPQMVNKDGNTALMLSIIRKADKITHMLVNTFGLNCNPMQISNACYTALIIAIFNDIHNANIDLLIQKFGVHNNLKYLYPRIDKETFEMLCTYNRIDSAILLIDTCGKDCFSSIEKSELQKYKKYNDRIVRKMIEKFGEF
jgi:hypothetical protein